MRTLAIVLLGACGRFGFDAASTGDGGTLANDANDANEVSPCTAIGPWSTPANITNINTAGGDSGPSLSPDGTHLVFVRGGSLWVSTRPTSAATFSAPQILFEAALGAGPAWTAAGDQLLFNDPNDVLFVSA